LSHEEKRKSIDPSQLHISVTRQAEILGISRASVYYQPQVNEEDIRIMRAIDAIYTKRPYYGSRRITDALEDHEIFICREHVQRLMRAMGLEAVYPKKRRNTSVSDNTHQKYPYLLTNVPIAYPNHVWGTDITYVRLEEGFCYLVAFLDWFSRYVVAWELSPSLESVFCQSALRSALATAVPEIHNSDQGTQFTSTEYTDILAEHGIHISMDGRGRCMDNIFTERLWRTVKYEDIFLKSYHTIDEARDGLTEYFCFYNTERKHSSLNKRTPADVYFNSAQ
jgi:putative transposase